MAKKPEQEETQPVQGGEENEAPQQFQFDPSDPMFQGYLQELLNASKSKGGGDYFFPAKGRTQFVVVPMPDSWSTGRPNFMAETFNYQYAATRKGKPSRKMVVMAVVLKSDKKDESGNPLPLDERWINHQIPMILPPSAVQAIVSQMMEGWNVLGRPGSKCQAITINRTGEGINTEYGVQVSKIEWTMPDEFSFSDKTPQRWAKEYQEREITPQGLSENDGGDVDLSGGNKKTQRPAAKNEEW